MVIGSRTFQILTFPTRTLVSALTLSYTFLLHERAFLFRCTRRARISIPLYSTNAPSLELTENEKVQNQS